MQRKTKDQITTLSAFGKVLFGFVCRNNAAHTVSHLKRGSERATVRRLLFMPLASRTEAVTVWPDCKTHYSHGRSKRARAPTKTSNAFQMLCNVMLMLFSLDFFPNHSLARSVLHLVAAFCLLFAFNSCSVSASGGGFFPRSVSRHCFRGCKMHTLMRVGIA